MNKQELRVVLLVNKENQGVLAEYLGISEQTLSKKINEKNGSEFSQTEIRMIKERYGLSPAQVDYIFFSGFVS